MTKFKKWVNKLSIFKKIWYANTVVIIIPLLVLTVLGNIISSRLIVDKTIKDTQANLNLMAYSLENLVVYSEQITKLVVINSDVQQTLKKYKNSYSTKWHEDSRLTQTYLDYVVDLNEVISSITLRTVDGKMISSTSVDSNKINKESDFYTTVNQDLWNKHGQVIWKNIHKVDYYINMPEIDSFSLFRAVIDGGTAEIIGTVQMNISQTELAKLFITSNNLSDREQQFIVDEKGIVIASNDYNMLYQDITQKPYYKYIATSTDNQGEIYTIDGTKVLVVPNQFKKLNWQVVGLYPIKELTADKNKNTLLILYTGLGCMIISVVIATLIAKSISRPISILADTMQSVSEGDLEVAVEISSQDEVGYLSKTFNEMVTKMSYMMQQIYVEQKNKRNLELGALQSQINPHFLYNTLDSVCALSQLGRNEDIFLMAKSIAMFYRKVLSQGKNIVTIKEELEMIQNYMYIQGIRYSGKFEFIIDVDEAIYDYPIVKLSIQPLVENAIYHGLKHRKTNGLLKIKGSIQKNFIIISVIDNGIGMAYEQLKSAMCLGSNKKSYGLWSVNERIKLYFGKDYGLSIDSKEDEGTTVDITLPKCIQRESENDEA